MSRLDQREAGGLSVVVRDRHAAALLVAASATSFGVLFELGRVNGRDDARSPELPQRVPSDSAPRAAGLDTVEPLPTSLRVPKRRRQSAVARRAGRSVQPGPPARARVSRQRRVPAGPRPVSVRRAPRPVQAPAAPVRPVASPPRARPAPAPRPPAPPAGGTYDDSG